MPRQIVRKVCKEGFTIIELLVVIAVIGVLIAVLLPSLQQAREVTQSAVCMGRQRSVAQLVNYYANDNKTYVPSSSEPVTDILIPTMWFSKLCYYYLDVRITTDPNDPFSLSARYGNGGGPERIFVCPTTPDVGRTGLQHQRNIGYGWNYLALTHLDLSTLSPMFATARMSMIKQPTATILIGDSQINDYQAYVMKPLNFGWWGGNPSYAPEYRHLNKANFAFADGHCGPYSMDESYYSDELWRMEK